jgi:hypothetical protein
MSAIGLLKHEVEDGSIVNGEDDVEDVEIKFVVPYETKWGEYLVVTGSRGLLGAGDVHRGLKMKCRHGHRGLIWEASQSFPPLYDCFYHYVVVEESSGEVIRRESSQHKLFVEPSTAGACIMLSDCFQVSCLTVFPILHNKRYILT